MLIIDATLPDNCYDCPFEMFIKQCPCNIGVASAGRYVTTRHPDCPIEEVEDNSTARRKFKCSGCANYLSKPGDKSAPCNYFDGHLVKEDDCCTHWTCPESIEEDD